MIDQLDKCSEDTEIICIFQSALNIESTRTASSSYCPEESIFLGKVSDFLEKAALILENAQLRSTNLKLEHEVAIQVADKSTQYNHYKSCLYVLQAQPELLGNILLFIEVDSSIFHDRDYALFNKHYNDIDRLSLTSKLFNTAINNNAFKEKIAKQKEQNMNIFHANGSMKLLFRCFSNTPVVIKMNPDNMVSDCKKALDHFGILPANSCRLIYSGKQLEDDRKLSEYGIKSESSIHVMSRLSGD